VQQQGRFAGLARARHQHGWKAGDGLLQGDGKISLLVLWPKLKIRFSFVNPSAPCRARFHEGSARG